MKAKKVAIIGKKLGMTQLYDAQGVLRGVTVVDYSELSVSGFRTPEKDGYSAVIMGYGTKKTRNAKRPQMPHCLREFRVPDIAPYQDGQYLAQLEAPLQVDVSGVMKGRGFAGAMKRWGFAGGPASHGSKRHRRVGSIGGCTDLGHVYKGRKMPGHMGAKKVTVLNQTLVRVDSERRLLFIKGAVPGSKQAYVMVRDSVRG